MFCLQCKWLLNIDANIVVRVSSKKKTSDRCFKNPSWRSFIVDITCRKSQTFNHPMPTKSVTWKTCKINSIALGPFSYSQKKNSKNAALFHLNIQGTSNNSGGSFLAVGEKQAAWRGVQAVLKPCSKHNTSMSSMFCLTQFFVFKKRGDLKKELHQFR